MAETEAIFNLRVDTGNSVNDVENLTSAVNDTQKATEGKGVTDFEKRLNQLDKTLKEGNLTMRQRSQLVRQYQQIALQAGETSPIGDRAVRSAAALTDQIGDLNQRVKLLSSDTVKLDTALQGISVGASAFQGVQSAIALTGVENEELIKSMQKLQAVQGVVNSIQTITNALNKDAILGIQLRVGLEKAKNFVLTGSIAGTVGLSAAEKELGASTLFTANAMKALRVALIATGIGAIVVAVGLLITNFDKVTGAVQKAYDWFDKLGKGVKVLIAVIFPLVGVIYGAIKALEYFGVIDDQQTAKSKANAKAKTEATEKEMNKKISAEKKKAKAVDDNLSFEIRKAKAAGKNTEEMEQKKLKAALISGRGILAMQKQKLASYELELKLLKASGDADSERAKRLEKSIKEVNKAIGEQYKENKKNAQDLTISEIEEQKKRDDENKEAYEKRKKLREKQKEEELKRLKELADAEKKLNEQRIKSEDEQFNLSLELMKDGFDKEFQQLVIQSDKRMEQAHGNTELEKQVLEQFEIDKALLIKKYGDIELAKIAEKEKKRLETIDFYNKLILDGFDLEAYEFQQNQAQQLATLQQALKDKVLTQEQYDEALKALAKDQAEFEVDLEKRKQEKIKAEREKAFQEQVQQIEKVIGITQQFVGVTSALNGLLNASDQERLKQVRGNAVEEEKIKRRMFERDKKQRKSQILVDTAANVVRSVANGGGIPSGIPFGVAAGVMGAFQYAAVSKQTFDGSSAGGSFNAPPPSTQAPVTTANETNPQQGGVNLPKMTKVVVLESDISNVQNKVKVTESLSGF